MEIKIDLTQDNLPDALGISDERCNELGNVAADVACSLAGTDGFSRAALVEGVVKNCNTLEEALFSMFAMGELYKTTAQTHGLMTAFKDISNKVDEDIKEGI